MSSKKDARVIRTRRALRDALLALIEQKPWEEITVRDIATVANVHYVTFFRHHVSKEAFLHEIAADQIKNLVELTLPIVYSASRRTVYITLCRYVDERRKLWVTLLTSSAAGTLKKELMRLTTEPAVDRVPKNASIPVELILVTTIGMTMDILGWWLAQPQGKISVDRIADVFLELVPSLVDRP